MNRHDKYVARLVKEWYKHGKIIIAVDYDSTVSYWPSIDNDDDIKRTITALQLAHAIGAHIVIFTASHPNKFEEIQMHCEEKGLTITGINQAPFKMDIGNQTKLYANIFLDDRGGLLEALDILEAAMMEVNKRKAPYTT